MTWWRFRWFPWQRPWLCHALTPLALPTYDGSGQVTHPDVLVFASPWHGHRYWMAMTPFPDLQEQFENPSLLVSDDGLRWTVPTSVVNPLVSTPVEGFHADPDLVYDPPTDRLILYYLHTLRGVRHHLKRMVSRDGRVWEDPEVVLTVPYQEIRSPAVVREAGGWSLWSVNMTGFAEPRVERRDSPDGLAWSSPRAVDYRQPGYRPSHLDIIPLPFGQGYGMVVQAEPVGRGGQCLFWSESDDGWEWKTSRRPLLSPVDAPAWASLTLYRSTLVVEGEQVHLWYSGRSHGNRNHLAHLSVTPEAWQRLRRAVR